MKPKGIQYVGPVLERSDWAQGGRQFAVALHEAGLLLRLRAIDARGRPRGPGGDVEARQGLLNNPIDYDLVLLHGTPDQWLGLRESGKRHIGLAEWFTSRLHTAWTAAINASVDLCLVPSEWNRELFITSGVRVPVRVLPYCLDVTELAAGKPWRVAGVDDAAYKFYAVLDFTEQGNPAALVRSYWAAFQQDEQVALILKAQRPDLGDRARAAMIGTLERLKQVTQLDRYPPIYLVVEDIDRDALVGLHAYGDCFVSLDRGHAFGLAAFEAAAAGNPILITGAGGVGEFASPGDAYLVRHSLTPVSGMTSNPWCRGDQLWAEPDCGHAIELLRQVHAERARAAECGRRLQARIAAQFSRAAAAQSFIELVEKLPDASASSRG